jgi:23S rRNA (uracil-5-)-methyltransferase RumA
MPRIPPCPHAALCGGCSLQDKLYDEQLALKKELLTRIFGKEVIVHPAPAEFAYRARVDFIIGHQGLGLRENNKPFSIVPVNSCLLLPPRANTCIPKINDLLLVSGLSVYDLQTHEGFLRYVTIKEDAHHDIMLLLTTAHPSATEESACLSLLNGFSSFAKSVYWLVHEGKADDVYSAKIKLRLGEEFLTETILGHDFAVAPMTFFQSNRSVAQMMFAALKKNVSGRTLDLYCGVGAISLSVADVASDIIGVELVKDSVIAARINAKRNNITATFFAEPVHDFVKHAILAKESFDTIIVDPPRTGLGVFVARALPLCKAKTIIYMSCNPLALRDDLQSLLPHYDIISLEGYDMFPQCFHVECLCVLVRKHEDR